MRFVALAVLSLVGGCARQSSLRPSVPYGGQSARLQLTTEVLAAANGAPGETAPETPGKLTLAEAYKLALRINENVALSELAVRTAEIEFRQRATDLYPHIQFSGTGLIQSYQLTGPAIPRFANGSLDVIQPLFKKGYFIGRESGRLGIQSAEMTVQRERERLARDVVAVYVNSVRARKLRDIALASVARNKGTADYLANLKKAGGALRTAELLAQLDLKRAERQVVDAERDVGVADATFRRIVGVAPPAELDLPELPTAPAAAAGIELARNRKDIKALDLAVQQAHAAEAALHGQRFWPRVDMLGSFQTGIYDPGDTGVRDQVDFYAWSVRGVVTIPIFLKGVEIVNIDRAANQEKVARKSLELQAKIATEEAQAAMAQVTGSEQAAAIADLQLKSAQEHFKLVQMQFKLGAITFLEVTNSQSVLTEAETAAETIKIDRVMAVYEYLFAIGALDLGKSK